MIRGDRQEGSVSAANYVLPADVQTMRALRRVPGLVRAIQLYAKLVLDDDLLLDQYAENVEVSKRQLPDVYDLYTQAGSRLGLASDRLPPLFIDASRAPNARTSGVERPFVVITVGLLEIMTPGEVLAILGHELGHVQAGHFTYTSAISGLQQLVGIAAGLSPVAFDEFAVKLLGDPAVLAWMRTAERTADRAGMLAAQRPRDMVTAMMKMAGAPPASIAQMHFGAFVEQSKRFDELLNRSFRRRLLLAKDLIHRRHPFPAMRVGEMIELLESPVWFDILEQVLDPSPGRWERVCDHCGGLVAEWDVVCRHCAWTVTGEEDSEGGDGSESEPPPDERSWREQLTDRAKVAGNWRTAWRSKDSNSSGDDALDEPPD